MIQLPGSEKQSHLSKLIWPLEKVLKIHLMNAAQVYTNPTTEAAVTTTTTTTTTARPSLSKDAKQRLKQKVMLCFFQGICRWKLEPSHLKFFVHGIFTGKVSKECRSQLTNNCQFSTATMTKGCRGSTRCQLQQLQQQQQQLVDLPHPGGGN